MNPIVSEIFKETSLSENEAIYIFNKFKKVTIKKGEFLLKPEQIVTDLHFIQQGCLRTYYIDLVGKEHTLQFAIKGWWISDYIALFGKTRTNSVSYIECIKDTTLYKISKVDFDNLCKDIPEVSHFHIRNLEGAFASFHKRILENLTLSAKERYLSFIQAYPNIEQNVKNYHIASYLGITTESLSRVRKEIANK